MTGTVELGLVIYTLVKPIFKIYIIVGLGYWLARKNILNVATCRDISDSVVSVFLPALVFENIVGHLQSNDIKNIGIIFFTATLLFSLGVIMAYATHITTKAPKRWLGGILSVGLFPNISDLPIAYVQSLTDGGMVFSSEEGQKGVAYICIFLAAMAFVQFSFGAYRLIEWDFRDMGDEEQTEEKIVPETSTDSRASTGSTPPQENVAQDAVSIPSSIDSDATEHLAPPTDLEYESVLQSLSQRVSRRRNSLASSNSLQPTRSKDLRSMRSQDIHDVINEYSEYDNTDVSRVITAGSDIGGASIQHSVSGHRSFGQKLKSFLITMGKNLRSPVSASLIAAVIIAMSPPLKALFQKSNFHIHDAPDGNPPLSFIMDTTSYVGAASVPLGLLLLGATISRLNIKTMPKGFWKTAVCIVVMRLVILPMFGVGLTTGLYKAGWYGQDKLLRFVSVIEFGLPNATSLVYFTAFYTDPKSEDHIQMDCLAVALIFQYAILFISLPFLVTFTLKVSLGF